MNKNEFIENLKNLISGESDETAVLANTAAYIKEVYGWFWIGFYIVRGDELVLGPFQGSVACYRIKKGRGVCGTSWQKNATIVVPDVEEFPGHIACSSLSKSEIVVPLRDSKGEVCAVLDIDSDELATFGDKEQEVMEAAARIVEKQVFK
ncbi:MAG: GAF domain-containing protein [Bacteroidaceae bacterium]|nr:GAF domain-containing protein [Bacteroidaceae bacterium]